MVADGYAAANGMVGLEAPSYTDEELWHGMV